MAKIGYKDILINYINGHDPETLILTEDIAKYVIQQTGQQTEADVKKAVNVNMMRLEKNGHIIRIAKGIYCRKIPTAFGYYMPNRELLFCKQLLYENNRVIGYETGLSAMNKLGLVSQMPKRRTIATNLYKKRVPEEFLIEIHKPRITVNETNYRYLQLLDAINNIDDAPVDTIHPAAVIKNAAKNLDLDTETLIFTARKYYSSKTLIKAIDFMLGDQYEASRR